MKAISIKQPWAWAIVSGFKPVENRTWRTSYRGPILIHASLAIDDYALWSIECGIHPVTNDAFPTSREQRETIGLKGGIVGIADLVDCVDAHESSWFKGPRAFVLANARPLPFFRCRGQLWLFDVEYPIGGAA